jgi:Ca-activated chloride channel family protein
MNPKKPTRPNTLIPVLVFSWGVLLCAAGWAEPSARRLNKDGIEAYRKADYSKAEEQFEKAARGAPDNLLLQYNAGAAKASQEKMDEAQKDFEKVSAARDRELAARANFGKGVVRYRQAEKKQQANDLKGALEEAKAAEEANKNVLRARPDDDDARVNLEMAGQLRKEIEKQLQQQKDKEQQEKNKEQEKQKEEQQKQDKQEDQQKQDKEQEQQKQDQQKQDQQKQDKQQQDQQNREKQEQSKEEEARKEQEKQSQEQKAQQDKQEKDQAQDSGKDKARQEQMDKDVTRSVLNLLDENDVAALKRMMKERYGRVRHPDKDW